MSKIAYLFVVAASLIVVDSVHGQQRDFQLVDPSGAGPATGPTGINPNFDLVSPGRIQTETVQFGELTAAPHPRDAMAFALADMQTLPRASRPYQRYIWIPDGDRRKFSAMNYVVNTAVSRASSIIQPESVAGGRLMRYDLRRLAPREEHYAELHELWEKLAFEPYFHITKTTADALPPNAINIKSRINDPPGSMRFKVGNDIWFRSSTNVTYILEHGEWIQQKLNVKNVGLVPVYGAHVNPASGVMLQGMGQSNAMISRYDFFLVRVLTSIDGGLYYDFSGIRGIISRAKKAGSKESDQDIVLRALGASQQIVENLRSDQRAAMFRSLVTGKARQLEFFQGQGVRPGAGTGLITITHDAFDNDTDPQRDPFRNLLEFKDRAREVIAERAGEFGSNGLHLFVLFDSNGALQDEVPPNIAADHTIPTPHPRRLQSAISCIRCHGPDEGFKPFANEVQTMMKGQLDIFGDLSSKTTISEQLDRLSGLYSGDLDKPIRRARNDYTDAVYRATNGMQVPEVSLLVSNIYGDYVYDLVDPTQACLELGFVVPRNQAVYQINQILPKLNRDIIGISPEDPIIGALKAGLSINRLQWEQVYPDAAFRAMKTLESQTKIEQRRSK